MTKGRYLSNSSSSSFNLGEVDGDDNSESDGELEGDRERSISGDRRRPSRGGIRRLLSSSRENEVSHGLSPQGVVLYLEDSYSFVRS